MFKKLFLVAALGLMVGCSSLNVQTSEPAKELADHSVMITRDQGGGGTGVILKSTDKGSLILTNRHICEAVSEGGVVESNKVRTRVLAMKISKVHDLCLIKVARNMKVNTKIAKSAGEMHETSLTSGHPLLMPNIITTGHFSGYMDVQIMTGIKKCDGTEQNPDDQASCAVYGLKAIIETLESQAISNVIAPGNSGSAVFNSKGEVTNLVFAGYGRGLSFGITVPNGHIHQFLGNEIKSMKWQAPQKMDRSEEEKEFLIEGPIVIDIQSK